MFICPDCGKDPERENRCEKCPIIYHNVIDVAVKDAHSFNLEAFKEEYPVYFKKYDKEGGRVKPGVIYQYKFVLDKLNMTDGVLLDFGCALAHASTTVKEHSDDITYIGADIFTPVLLAASEIYKEADYLLNISGTTNSSGWSKGLSNANKKEPIIKEVIKKKNAALKKKWAGSVLEMQPDVLKHLPDSSVDLVVASRIAGWKEYDKFFPEFHRVLKPGGHLFFWSNAGFFDWKKKEMFNWLLDNFEPQKKNRRISSSETLSQMMWGDKTSYLKKEVSEKELKFRFRGLMKKREA